LPAVVFVSNSSFREPSPSRCNLEIKHFQPREDDQSFQEIIYQVTRINMENCTSTELSPITRTSYFLENNMRFNTKKYSVSQKTGIWAMFFRPETFFPKMTLLGLILCEENRLRAFPMLENTFLTLIQENECFVLKRKSKIFMFSASRSSFWR
jgi:hypothetical protein